MANGIDLPEGLIPKAAKQMLAAGDLSMRIREVDGEPKGDTSRKDIWLLVWQLGKDRWKAKTIEDVTMHGPVTVYAWSEAAVSGSEMRMALIRALMQGGVFNEYEPAKQYVLHQVDLRVANVDRLK